MKIWAISLLLSASAVGAEGFVRPAMTYGCGHGPLDLPCASRPPAPGTLRLDSMSPHAYQLRFGAGGKTERGWDAKAGGWAKQALFWAAVVTTFLL
jgi:hypothetical protein